MIKSKLILLDSAKLKIVWKKINDGFQSYYNLFQVHSMIETHRLKNIVIFFLTKLIHMVIYLLKKHGPCIML